MFKLIVVSAVLAVVAALPRNFPSGRIVGGVNAKDNEFPYIVSIKRGNDHFCGGSIIDNHTILTAAHCVDGASPEKITIYAGITKLSKGGAAFKVKNITKHESYNSIATDNDIALLKLSSNIDFNEFMQPILLETENNDSTRDAVLCGWGTTSYPGSTPDHLQRINLKTISNKDCVSKHPNSWPITKHQICTLTKRGDGACHGDSGGPLTSGNKQIGIVSWGTPCAKGKPDVFTRVSSYISWINEHK